MKKLFYFLALIVLFSCDSREPQEKLTVTNPHYQLELLFDHDGCKVYRFEDRGRYVYWTDCRGEMTSSFTEKAGKGTRTVLRYSITSK